MWQAAEDENTEMCKVDQFNHEELAGWIRQAIHHYLYNSEQFSNRKIVASIWWIVAALRYQTRYFQIGIKPVLLVID